MHLVNRVGCDVGSSEDFDVGFGLEFDLLFDLLFESLGSTTLGFFLGAIIIDNRC
jgi:hypothetical protein